MSGIPSVLRRRLAAAVFLLTTVALASGATTATAATDIKIDFKPAAATLPLGYTAELGAAFNTTTGRGWVREGSLPSATHTPLDLTSRTRDRPSPAEQRLNSFVHAETDRPVVRGAFEIVLPPGSYRVTVGVGDAAVYDSTHFANIEGLPLIAGFVPTASKPFMTATGIFTVNDGRLTLDEIGGTNTKFGFIDIEDAPVDTTPPATPAALTATGGTSQITLGWDANTDADLAGYRLYRSTTSDVPTTGTPISGAALLTGTTYNDQAVTDGTRYFYSLVAVDRTGNRSAPSAVADALPSAPPPAAFKLKVDFQPASAPVAAGYVADVGLPFDATRGFGFVRQDSLTLTDHVGLDVTARTRRRMVDPDRRRDTFTQINGSGVPAASWEASVPEGDYAVTIGIGDPSAFDSTYKINAEGTRIVDFAPSSAERMTTGTQIVHVSDGRLTIDGIGGANGKLQYIDIAATSAGTDQTPPAVPSLVVAGGDLSGIHVSWSPNTEPDLAGYYVYRSVDLPVPATGTPLSGEDPVVSTSFNDVTAVPTTTYYYAVVAADNSGNRSAGSNPVTAKQPATPIDLKFNFQPNNGPTVVDYARDYGVAFTTARGSGWVRQDSLSGTHIPLGITSNARDRNRIADQRLDTFIHMQFTGSTGGTATPAAWEAVVPNGSYDVTVAVGDPQAYDSLHAINVEGTPAISEFLPAANSAFRTASTTVNVSDGRLTLDAIGGRNTKLNYVTIQNADTGSRPSLGAIQPADGATLVSRNRAITSEVNLPNPGSGVDTNTLTTDSVRLERTADGAPVSVNRNTSAGGDVIVVQPRAPLAANTEYRFQVTSALKDISGASFIPKTTTFTTGNSTSTTNTLARFTKTPQDAGSGELMTSIDMGPDERLYATTLDGKILRFPVATDGTLGAPTTITSIIDNENGPRHILGLAFDPASTPSAPILWVTSGHPAYAEAPDWTGKLTRLSGPDLSVAEDYLTNLPRSVRDHETNSIAFGPDGKLYITQGSNTAAGQTDTQWGERPEHKLNAAVLRVDPDLIPSPPLDVQTDEGGTYDPFAPGAPVTIYSSGIRNAYDLVWHRNGELYVPVNGSAANGNAPASPAVLPEVCQHRLDFGANGPFTGPAVVGRNQLGLQPDILVRAKQGAYYGHPNPSRCEYTFFGGNPTDGVDPLETVSYPVGTMPDRNFRLPSWNFGTHFSPNGAIEYKGTAFGGVLDGDLLVTRYSAGDDIVALKPDGTTKDITNQEDGIPGFGGLTDPLDLAQDVRNGNIYVTELGAARITLIKPDESAGTPIAKLSPTREIFNGVANAGPTASREITIRNSGNAALRLNDLALAGPEAADFVLEHKPSVPQVIEPDAEVTVDVRFSATAVGLRTARIDVTTTDPAEPVRTVALRGLGTAGETGAAEPSLQRILDTYEIGVDAGDDDPSTSVLPAGSRLGQEVPIQSFHKAGAGKVTVEPLSVFANQGPGSAVGAFGWNETNDASDLTTIATIPNGSSQALQPKTTGTLSFDPASAGFGLWSSWAFFDYRTVFSEDAINTAFGEPTHQARGYELRSATGAVVPNAYVVAFEALSGNGSQDFQDLVLLVRNAKADGSGAGRVQLTNLDGAPFDDRLTFSRIGSLAAPPSNIVHDRSSVRIKNAGASPLRVTGLPVTGPFQVVSAPALPLTLAPNATADVTVKFVAESGRVSNGTLTVQSDAAETPSMRVDLAGYWQSVSEQGQEPKLAEIVNDVMGFGTKITKPGQNLNGFGHVVAVGDEILSPYWRRVDPSKSVKVTQLSAFHTQGNTAAFKWFLRGGDQKKTVLTHAGVDGQTVMPRRSGQATALANATFNPNAQFGFAIDNELSDPKLNSTVADRANGCALPCGHHVRAWPAKNRFGQAIPGSYIIAMDYSGINYDYNDNVYIVTNITPDIVDQPVLFRVDTGSTVPYTSTTGQVWAPDSGLFTPVGAPEEGVPTAAIANTGDDRLYATYRGNVGAVPLAQRVLDYRFPVGAVTKVDVRLHFAERAWSVANARKFDVLAEGILKLDNLDLFAQTGAKDTAWTAALNGIAVTDGALDLRFKAEVDYPSIAGIEVLCAENCGSD